MPTTIAKRLNCTSTSKPDQRLHHQEHHGRRDAHLPGRNRPRARALDLRVDVAIDQIVPGAAGAAHHDGADQEQQHVPGIGTRAAGRRWRRAPPTTSRAAAAATSRSAGRGASAGGTAAPRRARSCRPNFRSHRRRVRSALISDHRASGLPVERIEGAAPGLRLLVGEDRSTERIAQARRPTAPGPAAANLLADLQRSWRVGL